MQPNCKYFDGQSSRAVPAFISTDEDGVYLLLFKDEHEERLTFGWAELKMYEYLAPGRSTVKVGEFPYASFEVNDAVVQEAIESWFNRHQLPSLLENIVRKNGLKSVAAGLGILAGIVLVCYFVIIPAIAIRALKLTPLSFDKEIGSTAFDGFIQSHTVDSAASLAIQAYFNKLGYAHEASFRVVVVHDDVMNAFALPGGYIVVYDKLLKSLKDQDELAGLLAHESIHILHRHTMQMLYKNLSTNILVAVLTSNSSGISSVAINNAQNLLSLKYSRSKETEADTSGQALMCAAGVSSKGMSQLFGELEGKNKIDIPDFLATHPGLDKRVAYLKGLPACNGNAEKEAELAELFSRLKIIVDKK